MTSYRQFVAHRSSTFLVALALGLVLAIGVADYLTGYHLSLGLFYVAPISLASWFVSRSAGSMFALISALVWFAVNSAFAPLEIATAILLWNTLVRAGFFLIIASLLASLKEAHARQIELARTDPLTGLLNGRAFLHEATLELRRAARGKYQVAALYLDLDNFKALNDARGHAVGDSVLRDVGIILKSSLRSTDITGRVGGDEFAVILSPTNPEQTKTTATRLQADIHRVSSRSEPAVTVTIGALTSHGSEDVETIISRADALMYRGKATFKGSVQVDGSEGDA